MDKHLGLKGILSMTHNNKKIAGFGLWRQQMPKSQDFIRNLKAKGEVLITNSRPEF